MSKFIFFILFFILIPSVTAENYRVYVDKEFGFFGVRANSTNLISYENKTLYINLNDTIEWENFAQYGDRVTIISDNRLWNDSKGLLGSNFKIFRHTFNKVGTFKVHIRENQLFMLPQDFDRGRDDELKTNDTLPDWFRFQVRVPTKYQTIVVGKNVSNMTSVKPISTPKPKNKVVATSGSNYVRNTEEEEYEDYSVVPQVTTKIEKAASPYQKYTILELIISIFKNN